MHLLHKVPGSADIFPCHVSHVLKVLHWFFISEVIDLITNNWHSMREVVRMNFAKVAFFRIWWIFQIIVTFVNLQCSSIQYIKTFKSIVGMFTTHPKINYKTYELIKIITSLSYYTMHWRNLISKSINFCANEIIMHNEKLVYA